MKLHIFWSFLARVFAFIAISGFLAACETISTGSHYDKTTNFGAYQTFSWIDEVPYISGDSIVRISPLTQNKIQQAIQTQLEKKGYTYIEDRKNADFFVAYTVGTRDKIRTTSYPIDYRGIGGWHLHSSFYYIRETREHSYTEGTLGVDVFDAETGKAVWNGWAEKSISQSDRRDPTSTIKSAVSKLFWPFPK